MRLKSKHLNKWLVKNCPFWTTLSLSFKNVSLSIFWKIIIWWRQTSMLKFTTMSRVPAEPSDNWKKRVNKELDLQPICTLLSSSDLWLPIGFWHGQPTASMWKFRRNYSSSVIIQSSKSIGRKAKLVSASLSKLKSPGSPQGQLTCSLPYSKLYSPIQFQDRGNVSRGIIILSLILGSLDSDGEWLGILTDTTSVLNP